MSRLRITLTAHLCSFVFPIDNIDETFDPAGIEKLSDDEIDAEVIQELAGIVIFVFVCQQA